jgi:toxin CcdB
MPRLDVHPMPGEGAGYVVDVQADLLSHLSTRTVVPLLPEGVAPKPISELNPTFEIRGKRHVLLPQAIASIPGRQLKRAVISLHEHHDRIARALDILLVGFRKPTFFEIGPPAAAKCAYAASSSGSA